MDETKLHEAALVHPEVRHEPTDASVRWVLIFAASLVVLGVVIHLTLWRFFHYMLSREPPVKPPSSVFASQRGQLPPQPRLEGLVSYDKLYGMPEAEQRPARTYGWVDRQRSIISIPVEEAMDVQARGLAGKRAEPGGRTWQPEPSQPSSANSGRALPGGQTFLSAPGGQP